MNYSPGRVDPFDFSAYVIDRDPSVRIVQATVRIGNDTYRLEPRYGDSSAAESFGLEQTCADLPRSTRLPIEVQAVRSDDSIVVAQGAVDTINMDRAGRACTPVLPNPSPSIAPN